MPDETTKVPFTTPWGGGVATVYHHRIHFAVQGMALRINRVTYRTLSFSMYLHGPEMVEPPNALLFTERWHAVDVSLSRGYASSATPAAILRVAKTVLPWFPTWADSNPIVKSLMNEAVSGERQRQRQTLALWMDVLDARMKLCRDLILKSIAGEEIMGPDFDRATKPIYRSDVEKN